MGGMSELSDNKTIVKAPMLKNPDKKSFKVKKKKKKISQFHISQN